MSGRRITAALVAVAAGAGTADPVGPVQRDVAGQPGIRLLTAGRGKRPRRFSWSW